MPPASPPHQNGQQPRQTSPSAAASFFAALNKGHTYDRPTRSFSVGADDAPTNQASDSAVNVPHAVPATNSGVHGAHLGRSQSMKNPTPQPPLTFSAAGADLQSSPAPHASASTSHYTPPAAARHPLFSHHAVPPTQQTTQPRAFSPALSFMSDPGPVPPIQIDSSCPSPPSPGSTTSSMFSPATAFLQAFSSRSSTNEVAPDAQGARVLDYTLGKILGRGGFSTVRQATHIKTGKIFACKIVKRDDLSDESGSAERFEDEIRIWQTLPAHDRLLPLVEMMRTPYATFMIMPCLEGSLLDVLRVEGGSESTARKWFPGVVAAVAVLHEGFEGFEGHMMHGDLKLDNFLVDDHGGVRLGDFGMTQKMTPMTNKMRGPSPANRPSHLPAHLQVRGRLSSAPDSPRMSSRSPHRRRDTLATADINQPGHQPCPSASLPYASPELLSAAPAGPTLAQDIWALGIILHALLTGRLPFNDSFDPRLQMKILRGQWEEPYVGHEWLEVLHGTLHRDWQRRWDIRRVRECDAVTGWREVRTKSRSRSRARVPEGGRGRRTPGSDSPVLTHHPDGISNPGRGRDRSRSRQAHGAASNYRRESHPSEVSHNEREGGRYLNPAHGGDGSRSRSQSATRRPPAGTPGSRPGSLHADVPRMSTRHSAEGLAGELDGMAITRGRSTQRSGGAPLLADRRSPSSSATSLHVTDLSEGQRIASHSPSAARPRRPVSGAEPKRGRSRPRSDASVPGSAGWWEAAFGTGKQETQHQHDSSPGSEAHTPTRNRGSPHSGAVHGAGAQGHGHGHVHGHAQPHHAVGPDGFNPAHHTSHSASSSRPPTLGFELDVVDENAPASRGRASATQGSSRSKSRGRHDHHL